MKISIFGAGYVGAVCAGCLGQAGHSVVVVDTNMGKITKIAQGESPIVEPGLNDVMTRLVADGVITATTDAVAAVLETDISFVCVGTPSLPNGSLDLSSIRTVSTEIGKALGQKQKWHSVVIRSTIIPCSTEKIIIPILEESSGLIPGSDFGVGYYPEFLREGSAMRDFAQPGAVVIGEFDTLTADLLVGLNASNGIPVRRVSLREAEAAKYANNAWHAIKISFANEIGLISRSAGIDGRRVMNILCTDTYLNISDAYLSPGFAFGGSCLPKDLRALRSFAHSNDIATPLIDGVLRANENQIATAIRLIQATAKRKVALLGLAFKAGTDDLRESPYVELAERLLGKGYDLRIYDPEVMRSHLVGANREFILDRIPHLYRLIDDSLESALMNADVVVIGRSRFLAQEPGLATLLPAKATVIDLEGHDSAVRDRAESYAGICW